MMKEAKPFVQGYVYAQRVECEEPCEGRLSRTVLWEGEGETPSLYSTCDSSGGISHAGHWLMDPTKESFEDHVFRNIKGKVKLLLSQLDDRERDVLGASALAWDVPEYSLFK